MTAATFAHHEKIAATPWGAVLICAEPIQAQVLPSFSHDPAAARDVAAREALHGWPLVRGRYRRRRADSDRQSRELRGAGAEAVMIEAPERIVAVAVRRGGLIFTMERPAPHHTVLHAMALAEQIDAIRVEQGFMTSAGRYVDRDEAIVIARDAGQLIGPDRGRLFSEDVW